MRLEKLSASSLKSSETCMARFKAERDMPRVGRKEESYNLLGSAIHDALQNFVQACYVDADPQSPEWDLLKLFWMTAYMKWFKNSDQSSPEFLDGQELLMEWYERTVFGGFEILSLESFSTYEIKTPHGPVKFNYIMDRLDKIGPNEYRVVDYKSGRYYLSPEDLASDIQARIYALMVQIMYPNAEKVWVEFDYLRYSPSAVLYKKSDNADTWRRLMAAIAAIQEHDEDNPTETLNNECTFCVRNPTCLAVRANREAGGVYSLDPIEKLVLERAKIAAQESAIRKARESMDDLILTYMMEHDLDEIDTPDVKALAKISFRRSVNADEVVRIIGPELGEEYSKASMTMKRLDDLLASGKLTPELYAAVESCVKSTPSSPRIETKFKTRFSQ